MDGCWRLPGDFLQGIDRGDDGAFSDTDVETAGAVEIVEDGDEGGRDEAIVVEF